VTVHVCLSPIQRKVLDELVSTFEPTKPVVSGKSMLTLSSRAALVSNHLALAAEWCAARGGTTELAVDHFRVTMGNAAKGGGGGAAGPNPTGSSFAPAVAGWALPSLLVEAPPSYDSLTHSPKMKVALHFIRRALQEGERVVMFSASVRVLVLAARYLVEFGLEAPNDFVLLDGSVPAAQRQAVCDQFNATAVDPEAPPSSLRVVLAASGSCGTGVSFVGASRAVLFEPQWSPAAEAQTIGRVVRFGQTQPVTVLRLVADTAFELRMLKAASQETCRRLIHDWSAHPLNTQFRGGGGGQRVTSSKTARAGSDALTKHELLLHRRPVAATSAAFDQAMTTSGVTALGEAGTDQSAVLLESLEECEDVIAAVVVQPHAADTLV
jgi:SNF2 family DNA or RNA helicase